MAYKLLVSRVLSLLACLFLTVTLFSQDAAAPDAAAVEEGKNLFRANCATCHSKDMKTNLTGPALGGLDERWAAYPREDLYAWIRNSQGMISEGHPRAVELWNQFKPTVMTPFPSLTDAQIEGILAYIQAVYTGAGQQGAPPPGGPVTPEAAPKDNKLLFILLASILGVLAVILARIVSNLNYMVQVQEGTAPATRKTLVDILTSKGIIAFVIFAIVVLGGYTTVNNAIQLGRQQGYQPEQPIKYSHAMHAGLQKIDCQYCHDSARRSKHASIPGLSTCMNCHAAIKVGSQYGTAELTKIYAAIGYDPSAGKYIENYDKLSNDDIEQIFKKWIADNYVQEKGGLDQAGEQLIDEQWNGVLTALTNEESGDKKIAGPVEWIRIHNLPDHVYFNHSQHVSVGKVACQTCHGQIQEMEVVSQFAPLSMGWCVNCHRQTEVQFSSNPYYESYERYHREIANGQRSKVTVEDIGGLECQKCHY